MTIYIGTIIVGRNGDKPVSAMKFRNKREFWLYCREINALSDERVSRSMNVDDLCATITDKGPGTGSRWHNRINRREAMETGVIHD